MQFTSKVYWTDCLNFFAQCYVLTAKLADPTYTCTGKHVCKKTCMFQLMDGAN